MQVSMLQRQKRPVILLGINKYSTNQVLFKVLIKHIIADQQVADECTTGSVNR